jgi:hypothetical protein
MESIWVGRNEGKAKEMMMMVWEECGRDGWGAMEEWSGGAEEARSGAERWAVGSICKKWTSSTKSRHAKPWQTQ